MSNRSSASRSRRPWPAAIWLRALGAGGLALLVALPLFGTATPALAQPAFFGSRTSNPTDLPAPPKDAKMLLEADQLVYDYDRETVSALGNVKIYYGGYALTARKVTYNRKSARLIAEGGVRIVEPGGTVMTAENIDITDDFRDGFVQELRVETLDKTYFAAQNAERVEGERTIIRKGVYTACEPCEKNPGKPPRWQIKAGKIIIDHKEHVITFQDARFEFMGVPLAWVPVFWTVDNTVKRKSGFLTPTMFYSGPLGFGAKIPYFWAPAPNYDLTFAPAYFTRQGFLASGEWRHRVANGSYMISGAAINQNDPAAFIHNDTNDPTATSGLFAQRDFRWGVHSTGEFQANPAWNYGWDFTLMSDRTFARNYKVLNDEPGIVTSQAHLTGLQDRNFFDARAYYFTVTTDRMRMANPDFPGPGELPEVNFAFDQDRQAIVHPVIDHHYYFSPSVLGGEMSMRSNLTSLTRQESDSYDLNGDGVLDHTRGAAGTFTRATTQLDWQRQMIGPAGLLLTPFAYVRADAYSLASNDPNDSLFPGGNGLTTKDAVFRGMPAIGLEVRWPWMATAGTSTHIFEPIGQLIVRPDESYAGKLPNEDAQSLVFDDTTLFDRDKFSGFDRVEGGTRLNIGFHYLGRFENGLQVDALLGQSYQLAGLNSFATYDLSGATAGDGLNAIAYGTLTGLEDWRSDIVSRISFIGYSGYRLTARGRFDPDDFAINRGEVEMAGPIGPVTASTSLIYLRNLKGFEQGLENSFVLRGAASTMVAESWRLYGSFILDLENSSLVGESVGLAYDDDCLTVSLAFNEVRARYSDIVPAKEIWLKVQLRTLGEGAIRTDIGSKTQ